MDEFLRDKIDDVKKGNSEEGMDIMGQLVRTSYGDNGADGSKGSKKDGKMASLTDAEIIGNAFIMIVAGHETTANTMHFTVLELAGNPAAQRLVQRDLDNIFGKAEPSTWDYESSVNPLLASYVGAAMNETLRMIPPVVDIPKKASPGQDQPVVIDGEKYVVPRGTHIGCITPAAHRNPRNWPSKPSKITGLDSDIDDYVPERWFRTQVASSGNNNSSDDVEGADTEDFGGFAGPDTSSQMFRPPRGSYLPFSDGARSCLGRRIAQVEMIAALSVVFQKYSIELAVDEWASDAEVERMGRAERAEVYKKAQAKARSIIRQATSILTLKLHGNKFIPIRLVPRGEERFVDWME
jgi:cytochrome P450